MKSGNKLLLSLGVLVMTAVLLTGMILMPSIPAAAAGDGSLLSDGADLLTDQEEAKLLQKLQKVSDRQDCDIAVYTVGDLEGKEAVDYADDLVDQQGLGENRSRGTAALLLYINEEDNTDREVRISTDQKGAGWFSDQDIDDIVEDIIPDLGRGAYAEAFDRYADQCSSVLSQKVEPEEKGSGGVSPLWIFGDLGIGAAIATMLGQRQKSKLKTRRKKTGAGGYADHEGIRFDHNEDIFLDRRVERRLRESPEDRESQHEAGTTHTSSSGKVHGGGGRKF